MPAIPAPYWPLSQPHASTYPPPLVPKTASQNPQSKTIKPQSKSKKPKVPNTHLLLDNLPIYLARRDIVVAAQRDVEVPLVVAEVEVDFAAVVEDVDFAWGFGAVLALGYGKGGKR